MGRIDVKLKPCPFCGGDAEERASGSPSSRKWEIVCTKCGCKTFKTVASPSHIEAWNRRIDEPPEGTALVDEFGEVVG